jgi:hypothetical protein
MKSTHMMTRTRVARVNKSRHRGRVSFDSSNPSLMRDRTQQSLIQWPTEQQIREVSSRLARISQQGIRWEARGDYFNSGDLAYQLQEILRATAELFKKSQRLKH